MLSKSSNIANLTHPEYDSKVREWQKWRLTYESGRRFIDTYLKRFSKREGPSDFADRRDISYSPAFAKAAIDEIKNSIFQRMFAISREGGSENYQQAIKGINGGVDLLGSSMNSYIGKKIISELLVFAKVGIFVDMPSVTGPTLVDDQNKHPYLYTYLSEDIRSWTYDQSDNPNEFSAVLLRDYSYAYNEKINLPKGNIERYRHLWIEDNKVNVQFYNINGETTDSQGNRTDGPIILNINKIPFIQLELSNSLMIDVANYQIALLNICSSDIAYILKANFPFYVEPFDPRSDSPYLRKPGSDQGGQDVDAEASQVQQAKIGITSGRKYPKDAPAPSFIHPSSEPLQASMNKQAQMKQEIRELVHLAVANLQASKNISTQLSDQGTLESGLSYIGLELENAERLIAQYWSMYEGKNKNNYATVHYPEKYSIQSEQDKREEIIQEKELMVSIPSKIYQKQLAKQIVSKSIGNKVSEKILREINIEIDNAIVVNTDPQVIASDVENGLVSIDTASIARGYPPGEAEQAKKDHADRLARIQMAQSNNKKGQLKNPGSRGVNDGSPDPKLDAETEKQNSQNKEQGDLTNKTRGTGKL